MSENEMTNADMHKLITNFTELLNQNKKVTENYSERIRILNDELKIVDTGISSLQQSIQLLSANVTLEDLDLVSVPIKALGDKIDELTKQRERVLKDILDRGNFHATALHTLELLQKICPHPELTAEWEDHHKGTEHGTCVLCRARV